MDHQQHIAQAVGDYAAKAQYTASFATVVLSFINENAAALGFFVAVCGLLVNLYYQRKLYRLRAKKFEKDGIVEDE